MGNRECFKRVSKRIRISTGRTIIRVIQERFRFSKTLFTETNIYFYFLIPFSFVPRPFSFRARPPAFYRKFFGKTTTPWPTIEFSKGLVFDLAFRIRNPPIRRETNYSLDFPTKSSSTEFFQTIIWIPNYTFRRSFSAFVWLSLPDYNRLRYTTPQH